MKCSTKGDLQFGIYCKEDQELKYFIKDSKHTQYYFYNNIGNYPEQTKQLSHPPDNPTLDKPPLPEKRKVERLTAGGWQSRRRGDRVHLSQLSKIIAQPLKV